MSGTARRVGAILLRHVYLWRGSWTRLFDLVYWPVLQVTIWGFMTEFLSGKSSWVAQAGGVFIGAVLLWDVLVRGQFGMTLSMLEEMWSRNLANLFVSPLRPWEFATALMGLSIVRSLVGVVPAALLAIPLFGYSVFELGRARRPSSRRAGWRAAPPGPRRPGSARSTGPSARWRTPMDAAG